VFRFHDGLARAFVAMTILLCLDAQRPPARRVSPRCCHIRRKKATLGWKRLVGNRCRLCASVASPSAISEDSMSRTLVILLVLTLVVPTLLFVAVAVASGTSPDLISDGLTFFIVAAAVTAMVFEIKRLADG
jgi:hypothetical protein